MQLIMTTDYAIRSLLYLSLIDRMAPASEVSERMNIPKQYLVTMSRKLKDAGLIAALPGAAGGYYLARDASEITLLDIMRVTEGTDGINRCTEQGACCERFSSEDCPVKGVYEELQSTVEELLSHVTLADLKRRMQARDLP